MRIALVYPPFLNSIKTTLPEFVNDNEGCFQPLGLLYIAAYIKNVYKDDCRISVIDSVAEKIDYGQIAERLIGFAPDLVGISCWTFSLLDALKVARIVKERLPNAYVCLGGPHVTIYPEETVSFGDVDFAISGDGERPFAELLKQLKGTRDFSAVPNLYYKRSGKVEKSSLEHVEKRLDELPFPDRTLVPLNNYYSLLDKSRLVTTLITSRGCPFQCKFCFQQSSGWRHRSIDSIITEMQQCVTLGIKNLFIFDETFTVDRERVIKLCSEMKKRGLSIEWSCRSRVDTIDEEMMGRLKDVGCNRISFGVESADDKVLKRLNKKISLDRAKDVFRLAKEKGFETLADFMIGCPEENSVATSATIKLALELDPDYVQFSLFTLFPATELYEEALREGVVQKDVWLDYARRPSANFNPPLWNIYTADEADQLLISAYKKFYLRFSYIIKRILRVKSYKEFKNYANAGLGLVKNILKNRRPEC